MSGMSGPQFIAHEVLRREPTWDYIALVAPDGSLRLLWEDVALHEHVIDLPREAVERLRTLCVLALSQQQTGSEALEVEEAEAEAEAEADARQWRWMRAASYAQRAGKNPPLYPNDSEK